MAKSPSLTAILMCICLLHVSDASAEELRPQLDDMVRHFGRVVFGTEYKGVEKQKVIAKWQGTVGIIIQGNPTQAMGKMASRHLNAIAKHTKIKFKQYNPGDQRQSIELVFMKRKNLANIKGLGPAYKHVKQMLSDPTMVCFFINWKSPPSRIVKGLIGINIEQDPARINSCLLEELSQVMGLPNDVDAYWKSIFRPIDTSTELSPWDQLYLKTLYDPRIKAGMKPVDALYTARTIFAEGMAKIP